MRTSTWPSEHLGNLFDIGAGKSVTPGSRTGEGRHPFLRTSNVLWGKVDLSEVDAMHYSSSELSSKTLLPGDLLVCEGGEIGRAAIWRGEIEKCGFQNHLHRLRSKHADVLPCFFMYYLQAGFTQLGIYEGAGNKTTIPNLSRNRLAALDVPRPSRDEQEKIAAVLWKTQQAAGLEEKLAVMARELKAAVMRRLFSSGVNNEPQKETEIGLIPKSWGVQPLEELRQFLQYGTSVKCDSRPHGNPVIRIPNVVDGEVRLSDLKYCELPESVIANLALAEGDLVFIRTNGVRERVGTCAVYRGAPKQALFASYLIRCRTEVKKLIPDFLNYYCMTAAGRAFLAGRASPAADGKFNLNTKHIDSVLVPVPQPDEQQAIVNVLRSIDRKISVHERRTAILRELFASLLHRLMTGEVRLDKLDIDVSEVRA